MFNKLLNLQHVKLFKEYFIFSFEFNSIQNIIYENHNKNFVLCAVSTKCFHRATLLALNILNFRTEFKC